MTRKHRSFHRLLWPTLALVVAIGFVMALYKRPPAASEPAPARTSQQ